MTQAKHLYEVRPRKDKHGVDLISDALPFGSLWCGDPNAVANAVRFLRAIYLAKSAFQSMAARTGVEPTLNIRDLARFRHKYALGCALQRKLQIR
jgi:hypothetical protein